MELEHSTYGEMIVAMKKLEDQLMASDVGTRIEAVLNEMNQWREEHGDGELLSQEAPTLAEKANQVFAELSTRLGDILPAHMRLTAYAPFDYESGMPPVASVEWQGRTYEVALCDMEESDYYAGFGVLQS